MRKKIHWKGWNVLSQPKKEAGMGFRDLRNFNLAMLAKQGWRLLQEQDSLTYRCFKARYFPRCNFLEASDAPNSSFVWKSLTAAQPLLKKGCCWRVGDGSSIRVTKDKWILNHPTNMVIHPPLEEEWDWRVSDIIDWRIKEWDRELIEAKFHRDDANAILRMPLSQRQASDLIILLHTKSGEYSVRSSYHVAREISRQESNKGESSRAGLDGLI